MRKDSQSRPQTRAPLRSQASLVRVGVAHEVSDSCGLSAGVDPIINRHDPIGGRSAKGGVRLRWR